MSNEETNGLLNVFQPGLKRGSASLPYAPHKRYFYVEHPTEGWRVYLRSSCFLHEKPSPSVPFQADRFLVVKKTGGQVSRNVWEPPKGQMEGKDVGSRDTDKNAPLLDLLAENARREVSEEAKLQPLKRLVHTGLVVQSTEPDYPKNHYFQYHIFQAFVTPKQIQAAIDKFQWYAEHPAVWERLKSDKREKDAIAWFDPHKTKLFGKWSPTIVSLYLQHM